MMVDCDVISENLKHYTNILFPPKIYDEHAIEDSDRLLTLVEFKISYNDMCPGYPNDEMDESCNIMMKVLFSFNWITLY